MPTAGAGNVLAVNSKSQKDGGSVGVRRVEDTRLRHDVGQGGSLVHAKKRERYAANIASAIFSAVMSTGKFVFALGTIGKIEASTTRRPLMPPRTRP